MNIQNVLQTALHEIQKEISPIFHEYVRKKKEKQVGEMTDIFAMQNLIFYKLFLKARTFNFNIRDISSFMHFGSTQPLYSSI